MKIKSFVTWMLLSGLLLNMSCASIVSKSAYPVTINSDPDQADISIIDETGAVVHQGRTPLTVTLELRRGYFRGKDYTVQFSKPGYMEHQVQLKRTIDPWYVIGNLFFGGLIGYLIVDPATGCMWTFDNREITRVLMRPGDTPLPEQEPPKPKQRPDLESGSLDDSVRLHIVALDDIPSELRSHLMPIN